MSAGWNLKNRPTSFLFSAKWLHSTKMCSHRGGGSLLMVYEWVSFVWPMWAISQDRLDRMKLVHDRSIPIILPSGKNILVNMVFKISDGYTNLNTRQIQSRLGSRVCIFIAPNANTAGYPTKSNDFIGKICKDTLSYHHPDQGMFQLHIL